MASEEPLEAAAPSSSPVPPSPVASAVEWGGQILKFELFQSLVDEGFWRRLASLKLETLGIDESPFEITGFYAPCSHPKVSSRLMLLAESFADDSQGQSSTQLSQGNRNKCPAPGIIYNMNTLENFNALDRKSLLRKEGKKILDDILSGKVEDNSSVLSRFLVISFADLKKWSFSYFIGFPALSLDPPASILNLRPAKEVFTKKEAESLTEACNSWRSSSITTGIPFFLISIASDSLATVRHLKDWKQCQNDGQKLLFGFYDPSHLPSTPGWPLRNYLAFISLRYKIKKIQFLCYREKQGLADLGLSLVGEALVFSPEAWRETQFIPETVGWEPKRRNISLAENMDPKRLAVSAADLNLKLMRWRTLPSLNLNMLKSLKCLLLGAGTLGCDVARLLMAWGVRKVTLVDNGRVSMSNLVRQSLYVFEDSLNGGEFKAVAAARSLKRIFPDMEADGIVLSIPMPGHPIPPNEVARILEDCNHLQTLIASHDVTFLLTDTRESRWLPTLFCANENKIAITAALGFDSYLVMRHGAGPLRKEAEVNALADHMESLNAQNEDRGRRLGCYFCNDVVAPVDSTSNRTLDQQCTVTRPGAAYLASALAVELLVGLLHHPKRIHAPGEIADSLMSDSEQPLGILPHQVRGSIPQFMQMALIGFSSNSCTACSITVLSEYKRRGMEFVLQAIDHPTYLEDLTGITDLIKSTNSIVIDWDNDIDTVDELDL